MTAPRIAIFDAGLHHMFPSVEAVACRIRITET
jgi:hypothetical protein